MDAWTIQPLDVWERLCEVGHLRVVPEKLPRQYVPPAYHWLVKQAAYKSRFGEGSLPWWLFAEKLDLRSYRYTRPLGGDYVRLHLQLRAEAALLFPSWAWNYVYCQDYLCATQQEHEAFYAMLARAGVDADTRPLPFAYQDILENSWQRLFTLSPEDCWDETSWEPLTILVIDRLNKSDVVSATPFVGGKSFPLLILALTLFLAYVPANGRYTLCRKWTKGK